MSLLKARDLWVAPPGAPDAVVRGLSFEVGPGEWVAVTGSNGSGKTSLALALAGLWPARRGELEIAGRTLLPHAGAADRGELAVLLQDPATQLLQPTVREEVSFASLNLGRDEAESERRAARWLEWLGLADEAHRDPRTLSAGKQQLVLLAGALATAPAVLIADEATAHLDAAARANVLARLREETRRGMAIVWVTQDPAELSSADRIVELDAAEAPTHPQRPALIPAGRMGAPLLRLVVTPPGESSGPRIQTSRGFEILLPTRGITAIEGRNGAGKSALLGAATGVIEIAQVGVHWVNPPAPPPILATQYPEQQLFEERVEDELLYAAVSRGAGRAASLRLAGDLLTRLGWEPATFLPRRTWTLSGGEKRIVGLLAALMAPAALIGLDEPTAGLDHTRRRALVGLLDEIAGQTTLLIASQDREWLDELGGIRVDVGC